MYIMFGLFIAVLVFSFGPLLINTTIKVLPILCTAFGEVFVAIGKDIVREFKSGVQEWKDLLGIK